MDELVCGHRLVYLVECVECVRGGGEQRGGVGVDRAEVGGEK